MKKVAFYTLGCKVNQYETEAMMKLFTDRGYQIVEPENYADIYIINTCTVTNLSERKSRQFIRRSKKINSQSIIGVVGCYAQVSKEEVLKIDEVDFVLGTKDRKKVVEIAEKAIKENIKIDAVEDVMKTYEFEEMQIEETHGKTRAFLKIQEGCNQFCSYCIIPYARGNIRSRKLENIINEVKKLSKKGFKEIVLTGIHLASYGKDLKNIELIDVIEEINKIDDIKRIRLGSLEPNLITEEFMIRLSKLEKICDHFHLSLQSGSDTVLKRMNRKYTTYEYEEKVKLIRKYMNSSGITTDIIVGFPGETESEFNETYNFVKKIEFSKVHIFKYSKRKGTPAASFKNQIDGKIKTIRSKKLIELTDELTKKFNQKFIGKNLEVLIEDELDKETGYLQGYTTNYIKVLIKQSERLENNIFKVRMTETYKENLIGEIIK